MSWKDMIYNDRFPKSNNYSPEFVAKNQMGPRYMQQIFGLMQDFDNFKVPDHLLEKQKNGHVFWEPEFSAVCDSIFNERDKRKNV